MTAANKKPPVKEAFKFFTAVADFKVMVFSVRIIGCWFFRFCVGIIGCGFFGLGCLDVDGVNVEHTVFQEYS